MRSLGSLRAAAIHSASPLYLYGPNIREGFARPKATKHSTGAYAIVTCIGARETSNWLPGRRAPRRIFPPVSTEMPANNLSVVFRRVYRVVAWTTGQRTVALEIHTRRVAPLSACHGSAAAMTVCQKSAARNATTKIRRIRPLVSRPRSCRRERSAGRDRSCETTRSPASEPTSPDNDKDLLNRSFGCRCSGAHPKPAARSGSPTGEPADFRR